MNVAIIGTGVMGKLLALCLWELGWQISLFENSRRNCSQVAAGFLSPFGELVKNPLIIGELGNTAINIHWPHILNVLKQPTLLRQSGSLVLAHPNDVNELQRFHQALKNFAETKMLNQQELRELEPAVTNFTKGIFLPAEGQINVLKFLNTTEKFLLKEKITIFRDTHVSQVKPNQIRVNDKNLLFDLVLDCRGMGDTENTIRPIRGELIWLHAPNIKISRPIRFLHPRYNVYLIPKEKNNYILGASEIEAQDTSPISVRSMLELLTAAYAINTNFTEARIIKTLTQLRPTHPDHLPKIKYQAGLIKINGLYRHGFLIAPTLAHEVKCWLLGNISAMNYPQLWEKSA